MKSVLFLAAALLLSACGAAESGSSNKAATSATPKVMEQKVSIDSPDGVKLTGGYYPAAAQNSPAILLLHQWQSDRHSFDEFAAKMNAKGFAVLTLDGRGFGESVKKADGSAVSAERTAEAVKGMLGDVEAAFKYLSQQPNVDPARVGIAGASYGSSLALMYAADEPKVAAVALISPGLNYFGNLPTVPAVKKYGDRPLVMIAAEDDKDSANAVRELKKAGANERYETQIYPSGGHGTELFKVRLGLDAILDIFLEKNLRTHVN